MSTITKFTSTFWNQSFFKMHPCFICGVKYREIIVFYKELISFENNKITHQNLQVACYSCCQKFNREDILRKM